MKKILIPVAFCLAPAMVCADSPFSYDAFGAYFSRNFVADDDFNQDLVANEFGASLTKEIQNQWYLGFTAAQSAVDDTISDGNFNYDVELTATAYSVSVGRYFSQSERMDLFLNAGLGHIDSDIEISLGNLSFSDEFMVTNLSASFGARVLLDNAGTFELTPAIGIGWDDQSEDTAMRLGARFAANFTEQFAAYVDASASLDDEDYSLGAGFRVYY